MLVLGPLRLWMICRRRFNGSWTDAGREPGGGQDMTGWGRSLPDLEFGAQRQGGIAAPGKVSFPRPCRVYI
jgi:hypothetical protein